MIRYNTQENTILTALGLLTRFCVSTVIPLGFLSVDVMVFPHYRLLSCFKGSPLTRKIISMPVLTEVGLSGVLWHKKNLKDLMPCIHFLLRWELKHTCTGWPKCFRKHHGTVEMAKNPTSLKIQAILPVRRHYIKASPWCPYPAPHWLSDLPVPLFCWPVLDFS